MIIRRLLIWVAFSVLAMPSLLFAHRDSKIELKAGRLEGLPQEYQPASFSAEHRMVTIRDLSVIIPDCLWVRWPGAKDEDFQFSASWYHDQSILPPYIMVSVAESGTKNRYELLLNLDTLAIIKFQKKTQTSESSWGYRDIPMDLSCASKWVVVRKK